MTHVEQQTGFDPGFQQSLDALIRASGGRLYIKSGYRSPEQQQNLWNQAIAKYGSAEAARKWVAPPGHSNHERGIAADIGGDLGWAHAHAAEFGLVFPMSWENWHIEPIGARQNASRQAYTDASDYGLQNPKDAAPTIDDYAASFMSALRGPSAQTLLGPGVGSVLSGPGSGPMSGDSSGTAATTDGTTGGGSGPQNTEQWAKDFLTKIGKPTTAENVRFVMAWQHAESGGGGGKFNPLNTTQGGYAGESNYNDVGVKNYTSYEQGIDANAKVINNGMYSNILAALDQGTSAVNAAHALQQSPWGTGDLVLKILGGK